MSSVEEITPPQSVPGVYSLAPGQAYGPTASVWRYGDRPGFFSNFFGGAYRLPNDNTLICEGGKAHLFEVTPDKEIVWDFVNPWRDKGSLGSVYRCLRYSPEYVKPLLERIEHRQ